jgi:hypothetical protein
MTGEEVAAVLLAVVWCYGLWRLDRKADNWP